VAGRGQASLGYIQAGKTYLQQISHDACLPGC
jgi:hypothetical protein